MAERTPDVFAKTSLFQKRKMRYPLEARRAVRRSSAGLPECWPPSTSMTTLRWWLAKSAKYGPIVAWRRKWCSLNGGWRRCCHSLLSASVAW